MDGLHAGSEHHRVPACRSVHLEVPDARRSLVLSDGSELRARSLDTEQTMTTGACLVEALKMAAVLLFCIWAFLIVTGCAAAIPFNECNGDAVCERRAISREDLRVRREYEQWVQDQCYYPNMWDGRLRVCRAASRMAY